MQTKPVSFPAWEKYLWPAACLGLMALIFWFSSADADTSNLQSGFFSSLLTPWLSEELASHLVRKTAHFTIYLLLGFCWGRTLAAWKVQTPAAIFYAMFLCLLYAASDEFHQLFIAGRSGQISDVLLDTSGGFIGSCASWLLLQSQKRKIR